MKVIFFHRKPRPNFNFSVENLFHQIRQALPPEVQWEVKELKYFSEGFMKRLYISLEAAFNQKDINHVTGDINFIAIFLKKEKTVLTVLDVGFMTHPRRLARLLLKWFWIILPVKGSQIITTISQSTKKELLKYVNIDPSRVHVIYVPISTSFLPSPKEFNRDEPVILQIGTKANKNVVRLVQALKGIRCRLELVGTMNDDLRNELETCQINFRISQNLTLEEIIKKYHEADILAFVSTYEGFGMPIVEANTVGRVVVTSNILSMPEVAGDAAHLVDPFSVESIRAGITKVIEDKEYRERLIQNGFLNRTRFDVNVIANQLADIYKNLLKQAHDN